MNARTWLPLSTLAVMALTACGGGVETSPTGSTSTAGATSSGSGGAGAGGSDATTTTGATSSGSGGVAGESVTLTMDSFTVPAGGEIYRCQNYANPFKGAVAEISEFESHMTAGSHHLLVFYKDGAVDSPVEQCSGLEFAATPYSTQLPDDTVQFPAGVAAQVTASTGFRLQSHYLNTTGKPIDAHVEVTFHLAKPETVTAHAGVLFVVEPKFKILPNSTQVVNHTCNLPYDMNLIKAGSHMHKHGTAFDATIGGKTVFQTTTWDEPKPALFSPAMPVKGGDKLDFNCTFVNNSPNTLTFGESADTNEMCIFVSSFYPVPDGTVTVGCN